MGPRAGTRCEPHWNMRPAFQRMKMARTAETVARAALREREIRAKHSRKTLRPRIKSQQSSEEWSADARLAPAEENQSGNGEKDDGSPDEQAVVGSEEHVEEGRGAP